MVTIMVDPYWDVDTRKPNGDRLDGAIQPPIYPDPVVNSVNAHPMNWAYSRPQAVAPTTVFPMLSNNVAVFGDSFTASAYPAALATLSGKDVFAGGVGGERSYDIAARQGGTPILVDVDNGLIPASGGVFVTPHLADGTVTTTLMKQGNKGMNPCKIMGIDGSFTWSSADSRYQFTRSAPGDAVVVSQPAPVTPYALSAYTDRINVFWYGRNNATDTARIMQDIASSVQVLVPGNDRFLVLGVCNSTSETTGTVYNGIKTLNTQLQATYGSRFIDIRRYLIDHGMADAGLVPTTEDLANIAADTIPVSLRASGDPLHLNSTAYGVVAQQVYTRLLDLGWLSGSYPEPVGPPVNENILASDSFANRANGTVLATTATDQALGGTTPLTWQSSPTSQFTVTDGVVSRGASTVAAVAGLPMSTADYRVDATLTALSTIGIGVRRTQITGGTDVRLNAAIDGTATLVGAGSGLGSFTYVAGDVLGIRIKGTVVEALKNGVVMLTGANATLTAPGYAALLAATSTVYSVGDITIRVPA